MGNKQTTTDNENPTKETLSPQLTFNRKNNKNLNTQGKKHNLKKIAENFVHNNHYKNDNYIVEKELFFYQQQNYDLKEVSKNISPSPTVKLESNFLAQLFNRASKPKNAIPVIDDLNLTDQSTLCGERPALRLDSRLVCKYEVLSVIGKGSFSQVLRVQHRVTKQFYAVKLVSIDLDFGAVNNELSILSQLQHPFVIRLEEVFRGVSKLFIVMEMASGGEMYDRVVSKGRFTEIEARQAVSMLLNGLSYLQSIHITHRDLKPENLLYSDNRPQARLLITDFGLAHQSRNLNEKMIETCGTPEYIAPEILLRVPYTNKVDMWAVGVITYILMSGIMPFDDDNRSRLYSHIITADYIYYSMFWSGSELAKIFVDSLLETNVDQRLSAVQALEHEWIIGKKMNKEQSELNVNFVSRQKRPSSNYSVQRTKSTRSIRSVTRSDHGHRVDPREVDKLAHDLEILAKSQRNINSSTQYDQDGKSNNKQTYKNMYKYSNDYSSAKTKHYGVF